MMETVLQAMDGYKSMAMDVSNSVLDYFAGNHNNYSYPWDFFRELHRYTRVSSQDVYIVFILAIILTVLRVGLASYIFKPMAKWLKLTTVNEEKFPESAWKLLYYTTTWTYTVYLLFLSEKYDFFFKPSEIWTDWSVGMDIPMDICVLYMIQVGFYIHSMYATIYLDHWRKDSWVMIFHHILSSALLIFSFAVRYYKIGVLVLFLHDIADVCLEFSKCNVYLKDRGGKFHALNDHLSTVGFLCFTTAWCLCRLYWYPIKVLYSSAYASRRQFLYQNRGERPFYLIFNCFLVTLLVLNVYWWMFILSFLYRVATGQMKEVDDIREEEVVEKLKPQVNNMMKQNGQTHQSNGKVAVCNGTRHKAKKDQ